MSRFAADEIVRETGGELLGGDREAQFDGISIDSRKIVEGMLFWAVKGERFNGNDFIPQALDKGAAGIVTDRTAPPAGERMNIPCIRVEDSLEALQRLAAYNRRKHPVPLVAITGSNGKTTTKEMLATILESRHEVLKNEGNLNNLIGVPLTLLKLHSDHEVAVVEMGMNRAGEIRALALMADPDIGVITNISEAHLEGLGSMEAVKRAKGELIETLCHEDKVILNADDNAVMDLQGYTEGSLITFGIERNAHIMASEVEIEWGKGTLFILHAGGKSIPVLLPVYGMHQLYNALAASAAALSLGFSLHEIREGLESYQAYSGRMEIIHLHGVSLINDSYNANPASVRNAVKTMMKLAGGKTVAVLGDMLEMGEKEREIHADLGAFVHSQAVDCLVTVGSRAAHIAQGALQSGMAEHSVFSFETKGDAMDYLTQVISEGTWILVKGSRSMKMEEIVSPLIDHLKMKETN